MNDFACDYRTRSRHIPGEARLGAKIYGEADAATDKDQ
jgi:hypothetical protein